MRTPAGATQKNRPYGGSQEPDLNLLRPDIRGLLEEGERRASLIRTGFVCAALGAWLLVGMRIWEIGIIVQERRPDELEIVRLSEEIDAVQLQLNQVPRAVRQAREDISAQVNWADRMSEIRSLAPSGCVFGVYSVHKDASVQLSGVVRDPSAYAQVLDSLSKTRFVTSIKSASLVASKLGGYEFRISLTTLPANSKD